MDRSLAIRMLPFSSILVLYLLGSFFIPSISVYSSLFLFISHFLTISPSFSLPFSLSSPPLSLSQSLSLRLLPIPITPVLYVPYPSSCFYHPMKFKEAILLFGWISPTPLQCSSNRTKSADELARRTRVECSGC